MILVLTTILSVVLLAEYMSSQSIQLLSPSAVLPTRRPPSTHRRVRLLFSLPASLPLLTVASVCCSPYPPPSPYSPSRPSAVLPTRRPPSTHRRVRLLFYLPAALPLLTVASVCCSTYPPPSLYSPSRPSAVLPTRRPPSTHRRVRLLFYLPAALPLLTVASVCCAYCCSIFTSLVFVSSSSSCMLRPSAVLPTRLPPSTHRRVRLLFYLPAAPPSTHRRVRLLCVLLFHLHQPRVRVVQQLLYAARVLFLLLKLLLLKRRRRLVQLQSTSIVTAIYNIYYHSMRAYMREKNLIIGTYHKY